jgi:hypothetical protein
MATNAKVSYRHQVFAALQLIRCDTMSLGKVADNDRKIATDQLPVP